MTTRIGTAERDGTFHSQGQALKVIFDRHPVLQPVSILESSSASIENANRLHAGDDRIRLHGLELDRPRQER